MLYSNVHDITRLEFSRIREFVSQGKTSFARELVIHMDDEIDGKHTHTLHLYSDDKDALDVDDARALLKAVLA